MKILLSSIIGGILYRLGGIGDPFDTKVRDMGVATLMTLFMWHSGFLDWWMILSWGLMFGSLTTYWDFVNKWHWIVVLSGHKDPDREYWWNWVLHAFFINLAMLPTVISQGLWEGFFIRSLILPITVTIWSEVHDDVNWEEFGRGALIIGTLACFG